MSDFAIPNWDTNPTGDAICKKLFKKKGASTNSNKVKSKFQSGSIEKAKTKRKKIIKNIKDNLETVKSKLGINNNKDKFHVSSSKVKKMIGEKVRSKMKSMPMNLIDSAKSNALKFRSKEGKHLLENEQSFNNEKDVKKKNKKRRRKMSNLKSKMSNLVDSKNAKKKIQTNIMLEGITKKKSTAMDKLRNKQKLERENLLKKTTKKKNLSLRERMLEKLKASRFRYLNEQIYSSESNQACELFKNDPEAYQAYHEGYRQQVERWPINPVDVIINTIKKMPKNIQVADFGCGDAKISQEVNQKVHSFDLIAANERVTACDVTKTPLEKESVDVVVFCLSLMGTNLHDYIKEANRVLKVGGTLKIAEVESRFDDVDEFIKGIHCFGFKNTLKDLSHNIFYFMDFKKISNVKKGRVLPTISLHPCLYKKR